MLLTVHFPILHRFSMHRLVRRTWLAIGLAIAPVMVSCLVSAGTAMAAGDVVVAAVASRPGSLQPDGGDAITSVRSFVEGTKKGRLLGRPLRLITYEEDCSVASAANIAGQIVARGAHVVIGHLCSAAAIAAAPIYARHGILMISPGARNPRLTDQRAGPGVFRLAGRDDRFGVETAALIATRFSGRRIAIVNDLSVQARTLADAVDRELKARSITPVLRAPYIAGEREYNAVIDKLAAAEADVIVIPAQPVEAAIIIEGLRARQIQATLIGSEILAVPEIQAASRRLGDALIVMLPSPTFGPPVAEFAAGELGRVQARPDPLRNPRIEAASQATAAIEAWVFAVERAGSLDIGSVARVLETESAPTVIGPVRFGINGDAVLPSYTPHTWRGAGSDGGWQRLTP